MQKFEFTVASLAKRGEQLAAKRGEAQESLNRALAARQHPRRGQLRGARGSDFNPLAPDVVDLDAIEEPKGASSDPVLREANFQPLDRGPARALQVTP
jgi:hypothetical protein